MGEMIRLVATDGHEFDAYLARPARDPVGGLVLVQEIFGMTGQMQRCADRYAERGYLSVLPALFDRVERGLTVAYDDFATGGAAAQAVTEDQAMADCEASRLAVREAGRSAIIGYCWGGTLAYQAASLLGFDCAVSYYGGGIGALVGRLQPKIPVQYHFGAEDSFIPEAVIDKIREADPDGEFYVYEGAGHGFNCDDRDSYDEVASKQSEELAQAFLERYLAAAG
jgi:carboxymethylenebutenolidase